VELKNHCDQFMSQVEDQVRQHKVNDGLKKLIDRDLEALRRSIAE
jgi:exonuclease VII small subunit